MTFEPDVQYEAAYFTISDGYYGMRRMMKKMPDMTAVFAMADIMAIGAIRAIQDAGLRGFQGGGAQVSEKHCGFVINKEQATAADVAELMRQVSLKVKEQFGVELEAEVKRLGEF